MYGSDTDKDECIQDLEQNIKSAEEKFNRENEAYYEAALNKLENQCKNLFTTFRQEYQRGKQREKNHAEKYINVELDEKIRSSKTGSKHSKKSTGSKHSKKSTGVPPDITIKSAKVPIITPIAAISVIIFMVLLLLFENKYRFAMYSGKFKLPFLTFV